DILGLMGDAVDNIPGIPGIGQKTAVKLLKEYGSIEELIKNTADLKGKQKENVENFAAQGLLSKELATIMCDVPITYVKEDLKYEGIDEEKVRAIFTELEFRTLASRVFKGTDKKAAVQKNDQLGLFGEAPAPTAKLSPEIEFEEETVNVAEQKEPDTIASNIQNYHKVKGKAEILELVE